jgi:F0F1-type ATP synthase assembly protein I
LKNVGLGFLPPCGAVVGYVMGYGLDRLFQTHFLYVVFVILGAIGGLTAMVRQAQGKP